MIIIVMMKRFDIIVVSMLAFQVRGQPLKTPPGLEIVVWCNARYLHIKEWKQWRSNGGVGLILFGIWLA